MAGKLEAGAFVELRGRPWLVEETVEGGGEFESLKLSCIADDAQGEQLEVIWDAEIGPRVLGEDNWQRVGAGGPDSADVFAAHLRVVRWNSSTAAERDLFQAPFRAGMRVSKARVQTGCATVTKLDHERPILKLVDRLKRQRAQELGQADPGNDTDGSNNHRSGRSNHHR